MPDITEIPTEELRQDLKDFFSDIVNCRVYLIINPDSSETRERLRVNREIVEKIKVELRRRGEQDGVE